MARAKTSAQNTGFGKNQVNDSTPTLNKEVYAHIELLVSKGVSYEQITPLMSSPSILEKLAGDSTLSAANFPVKLAAIQLQTQLEGAPFGWVKGLLWPKTQIMSGENRDTLLMELVTHSGLAFDTSWAGLLKGSEAEEFLAQLISAYPDIQLQLVLNEGLKEKVEAARERIGGVTHLTFRLKGYPILERPHKKFPGKLTLEDYFGAPVYVTQGSRVTFDETDKALSAKDFKGKSIYIQEDGILSPFKVCDGQPNEEGRGLVISFTGDLVASEAAIQTQTKGSLQEILKAAQSAQKISTFSKSGYSSARAKAREVEPDADPSGEPGPNTPPPVVTQGAGVVN